MKLRFLSIMIGGVLALGLAGCESMGMKRQGASSGAGTTTSGGYRDNGMSGQNSDATGWGIPAMPSGQVYQ